MARARDARNDPMATLNGDRQARPSSLLLRMDVKEERSTSLLYIRKRETAGGGGDEVFDRKVAAELSKSLPLSELPLGPVAKWRWGANILRGHSHPRYKYYSRVQRERIKRELDLGQIALVSWEPFESLVPHIEAPTILIVHNVISDALRQIFPRNVIAWVAAAHSAAFERRIYQSANLSSIIVLSERDRALVLERAPGAQVVVAPPGLPPLLPLRAGSQLVDELVLAGTYEWWPKRRDILQFAKAFRSSGSNWKVRADGKLPPSAHKLLEPVLFDDAQLANSMRIGIVPDTFLAGFKLKVGYYLAKNCICVSFSDIRSEFAGIRDAGLFVRYVRDFDDINAVIADLKNMPVEELRLRFNRFRSTCAERFSWHKSAEQIANAVRLAGGVKG